MVDWQFNMNRKKNGSKKSLMKLLSFKKRNSKRQVLSFNDVSSEKFVSDIQEHRNDKEIKKSIKPPKSKNEISDNSSSSSSSSSGNSGVDELINIVNDGNIRNPIIESDKYSENGINEFNEDRSKLSNQLTSFSNGFIELAQKTNSIPTKLSDHINILKAEISALKKKSELREKYTKTIELKLDKLSKQNKLYLNTINETKKDNDSMMDLIESVNKSKIMLENCLKEQCKTIEIDYEKL